MSNTPVPQPQPSTAADCTRAQELLSAIEHQKAAFDAALKEATTSGDFTAVESLGAELQKKVDELEVLTQSIEDKQDPEKAIQQKIEAARAWVQAFEQQNSLEHDPDRFLTCEVGGMSAEHLIEAIESTPEEPDADTKMQIGGPAKSMLENTAEFIPTKEKQQMYFIRLTVAELGFPNGATTTEILTKAKELGLELCPPDAGPHLRLHLTSQPMNEWLNMGMQPITHSDDGPDVFVVGRSDDGAGLDTRWERPDDPWDALDTFVFRYLPSV